MAPDAAFTAEIADRLSAWMDENGFGSAPITDVMPLTGGTQNVLLRFQRAGRSFVLRRPPPRPRPESNETMRREARVLGALATTAVPHPGLIAACGDETVLGVAFYLMEPVDGFNPTTGLPALHAADPAVRHRMGLALVEGAVAVGAVDTAAVGLTGFGRPDNYLVRQADRWRSQLEGYAQFDGWPGPAELPGIAQVERYVATHVPDRFVPGLMHGDYTLTNVMYRPDGGELAAIIDWELSTIGDPLIDLGWLLATWPGSAPIDLNVLRVAPWDGFPSADELVAHYGARTSRNLDHLDWYYALACYKLAIILEGSFARSCAGRHRVDTGRQLHETARRLIRRALHRIA